MSAPRVVNVEGGAVWTRREAVRDGQALYAPEKCGACPEFVMVTYAELEARGIVGSADVLPMPVPVVPEPQEPERGRLRAALIEALGNAHRTHPCPALGDRIWSGCVHYDEAGRVSGVGSCHSERRADAVLAVRDAELERLRARIAELEAELLVANGALDDAAQARRNGIACPCPSADRPHQVGCPEDGVPTASLREPDGEFHGLLHHSYRVPHDLPELGGPQ